MQLIKYRDKFPKIGKNVFLAEGVKIIGDVTIADNVNIWYNTVIRGDVAPVTIGANTNIQDGTIIHTSRFEGPTHIGAGVTIGHKALIHACNIEDSTFIGMGSIIMDYAKIEKFAYVAAGALISPNKVVKSEELWIGAPAKFKRTITKEEKNYIKESEINYLNLAKEYM